MGTRMLQCLGLVTACGLATAVHGEENGLISPNANTGVTIPVNGESMVPASRQAGYLLSDQSFHGDPEILWPGFLSGLQGFDSFYTPVGNPLYFEAPTNDSRLSFLYLHHEFASDSTLNGGELDVYALQARIAITDRIGFIATKDGFSQLDAGALPEGDGWNDIAFGLKYVFWADEEKQALGTVGFRYMIANGHDDVLQGNVQELSPFISFGKGYGDLNILANLTWRAPLDDDDGNHVLQWSAHADYELVDGFAPMIEIHGLHYLSNGSRLPLPIGGLDYANLGSTDVEGDTVVWMGVGAGFKLTPNLEVGATYEFALTDPDDDIMDERVTVLVHLRW